MKMESEDSDRFPAMIEHLPMSFLEVFYTSAAHAMVHIQYYTLVYIFIYIYLLIFLIGGLHAIATFQAFLFTTFVNSSTHLVTPHSPHYSKASFSLML